MAILSACTAALSCQRNRAPANTNTRISRTRPPTCTACWMRRKSLELDNQPFVRLKLILPFNLLVGFTHSSRQNNRSVKVPMLNNLWFIGKIEYNHQFLVLAFAKVGKNIRADVERLVRTVLQGVRVAAHF